MKIVAERELYHSLYQSLEPLCVLGISIAIASIVPTPFLKPREFVLIGWEDHLTLASTNRSMTFEKARSNEMGLCVLSLFGIGIFLAIFHLVGSLPSENDWMMSRRKMCLVDNGVFLSWNNKQCPLLEQYP